VLRFPTLLKLDSEKYRLIFLVTQPGIPIRTRIGASDQDFIRLSTGVQTEFANNLSANLGYETTLGKDNFSDNSLNATVRYQF
jgi:outer membrane lipase/esterase